MDHRTLILKETRWSIFKEENEASCNIYSEIKYTSGCPFLNPIIRKRTMPSMEKIEEESATLKKNIEERVIAYSCWLQSIFQYLSNPRSWRGTVNEADARNKNTETWCDDTLTKRWSKWDPVKGLNQNSLRRADGPCAFAYSTLNAITWTRNKKQIDG